MEDDFTSWLRFSGFTRDLDGWHRGALRVTVSGDVVALYVYDADLADPAARLAWTAVYAGAPPRVAGRTVERALDDAVAATLPAA